MPHKQQVGPFWIPASDLFIVDAKDCCLFDRPHFASLCRLVCGNYSGLSPILCVFEKPWTKDFFGLLSFGYSSRFFVFFLAPALFALLSLNSPVLANLNEMEKAEQPGVDSCPLAHAARQTLYRHTFTNSKTRTTTFTNTGPCRL